MPLMKDGELTESRFGYFQAELSEKFHWKESRQRFEMRDFRGKSKEFNQEYPVILSTTYSIKGTLNFEHTYDYLIVDETAGGFSYRCTGLRQCHEYRHCGDLQQLPNVLNNQNIQKSEEILTGYSPRPTISPPTVCSLLLLPHGRRLLLFLLQEHYRCHPKIINFCNQKLWRKAHRHDGDHEEPDVLTMPDSAWQPRP